MEGKTSRRVRVHRLNVAWLDEPPPIIDCFEWETIEGAYGAIPENARAEISRDTNRYLELSSFARAALPVAEASDRAKKIRHSAQDLFEKLSIQSDSLWAADRAIGNHLKAFGATKPYALDFDLVADVLSCLIAACAKTESDLSARAPDDGLDADEHWRHWVRKITRIAERYKLPRGVRKDRHGNENWKPSPFVALIEGLQNQKQFPEEHRRQCANYEALSQAIVLARQKTSPT